MSADERCADERFVQSRFPGAVCVPNERTTGVNATPRGMPWVIKYAKDTGLILAEGRHPALAWAHASQRVEGGL